MKIKRTKVHRKLSQQKIKEASTLSSLPVTVAWNNYADAIGGGSLPSLPQVER